MVTWAAAGAAAWPGVCVCVCVGGSIEMRTDVKSQHLSLGLWPGSVFYW